MAEVNQSNSRRNASGKPQQNKKPIRVDLTPMVDLGFILLTFFVFTTTMSEAKVMDLHSPRGETPRALKASGACHIILGKNQAMYYYMGLDTPSMKKIPFDELSALIMAKKRETNLSDLMFVIKASDQANFKSLVDVIDEMAFRGIPPGHFAESELSEHELQRLSVLESD